MRIARAAACLAMTAAAAVLAAQAQQQAPQVFRSGVQVATVYAQVIDSQGQPIRGLSPSDFTVRINGAAQPVVAATFLAAPSATGGAPPVQSGRERTNLDAAGGLAVRPRTLVILIDDLSYPLTSGDLRTIRAAAASVLNQLAPSDLVGLVTTSGIGPQVAPTTDSAAVASAIARVGGRLLDFSSKGDIFLTFEEANAFLRNPGDPLAQAAEERECRQEPLFRIEFCASAMQVAASLRVSDVTRLADRQTRRLADLASALAVLSGPKTLVMFSAGVPNGPDAIPTSGLVRFGKAAAEAGLRVYTVTGTKSSPLQIEDRSSERATARSKEQADFQNGVDNVATAAGGRSLRLMGSMDRLFDRILTETSGFYELRVELPLSNRDRVLNAAIGVRRSGATVLAHKQVIATEIAAEPVSVDQELDRMLRTGAASAAVPLSMATSIRRSPSGRGLELGVNAAIAATVPQPVKVKFALLNEVTQGLLEGDVRVGDGLEAGRIAFAAVIPPGRYQLRLGVADAAGNIGTISYPVQARLTPVGSWSASDLRLSWDDGEGRLRFFALEALPASATTVGLQLELYAASATTRPPETTVSVELLSLDAKQSIARHDVPVRLENDRASVSAAVPVQSLGPGIYALRVVVMEQGKPVGTLTAAFRKVPMVVMGGGYIASRRGRDGR